MSTYLWINILAVLIPVVLSFDKRVHFYTNWKHLFPAVILTGIVFVIWDIIFTEKGIWGFNPIHLSGVYFFNIPLEECMFFLTIPYASVFTYEVFNTYLKKDPFRHVQQHISVVLIALAGGLVIFYNEKAYTTVTAVVVAVMIVILKYVIKSNYISRFYFTYMIILIPFLVVNGILTGTSIPEEVVWYNPEEIIGLRLFTIPVEDILYGLVLILMNISIYEAFKKVY